MSYKDKLKDRRWRDRRRQILVRDNFKCQSCLDKSIHNDVHHIIYEYPREPWEYPDSHLITLCRSCHGEEHRIEKLFEEMRLSGMLWSDIYNKFIRDG